MAECAHSNEVEKPKKKDYSDTLETTTDKLKDHYKSQDKLVPLFDDLEQLIDTCYIQLALLHEKYFKKIKEQITNKKQNNEDEKEKWSNSIDHSMIYGSRQEIVDEQDIWKLDKKGEEKEEEIEEEEVRHISIRGEAGSGKSVLTQRIAYLWANGEMWNNMFEWLLHIPFRNIVNLFDDENKGNTKSNWSKIMNALNIPGWNTNDTNIVYSNGGLLVLDGFDEIANDINKKPGLQQWLRYCTENAKYSVIITSRPNVQCSYLKHSKIFNVIGFQSQDIRNYVYNYFQNVTDGYNNKEKNGQCQAKNLLQKLNSSKNLKLLSHTPLYLRLFCYLTRQQLIKAREEEKEPQNILALDDLNNISVSKLYEKLLACYMKWNWIKFNGTTDNPSEQEMFSIFEMEIDYLSRIAWEGLKDGQVVISCKVQEKVLNIIKSKYPREHISVISQWSRINSFGFLQGQESVYPTNSVYFPHLTFQEWFAAYYLVNCLYSKEIKDDENHEEVCRILTKEQLNPKYSIMIPFMAGILYGNIENEKDSSGSGLLYFWKQLQSLPLQMIPIHQIMLHIRCLDACKVDTESKFLSHQLKNHHKTLIYSFKQWLEVWATPDKVAHLRCKKIVGRPLDKIMEMYLPNLQYVLVHPDIHSYVTQYMNDFIRNLKLYCKNSKYDEKMESIMDGFYVLPYLCVSTETLDMLVECFRQSFECKFIQSICMKSHGAISAKLKEMKLDEILQFLLDTLPICDNSIYALSLGEIVPSLNEKQLTHAFDTLMEGLETKVELYAEALAKIAVQLGKEYLEKTYKKLLELSIQHNETYKLKKEFEMILKNLREDAFHDLNNGLDHKDQTIRQICMKVLGTTSMRLNGQVLDNIFRSLMKRFNDKDTSNRYRVKALEAVSSSLNEEQADCLLQCLKDGLEDNRKDLRNQCVQWIGTFSKKWNQGQLDRAFEYLLERLIKDQNHVIHWSCAGSLKKIIIQLDQGQLNNAFKKLMDILNNDSQQVRQVCVDLLIAISTKLNQIQLEDLFMCLMTMMKAPTEKKKRVRYSFAQAIRQILLAQLQINEKQVDVAFEYLMNGLNDKDGNVQYSCALSIGNLAQKLKQEQLDIAFKNILKKFKHTKDNLVRMSCAESLGQMAMAININQTQLKNALHALVDCLHNKKNNTFVHKQCAHTLKQLKKNESTRVYVPSEQLLEKTLTNFKKKQLNDTVKELLNGLKDKDGSTFFCCVGVLPEYVGKLKKNQLADALKCLINGLNDEDSKISNSCKITLQTISLKLEKIQLNTMFTHLIDGLNATNDKVCSFCTETLGTLANKLSDKQLCAFVTKVLQILKSSHGDVPSIMRELLSEFSDDLWKRVVMKSLKEHKRKEKKNKKWKCLNKNKATEDIDMEALAFGLLIYSPCIQFDFHDDNIIINSDDFKVMNDCCRNQSSEWKFPTEQKWESFDNIPQPHSSTFPNSEKRKSYNDFVCEAVQSGNMPRLMFILEHHYIDINDVFNKDGYSLLLLAIQNKHWNIVRYCLTQGARIDIRGGVFDAKTPLECIIQQKKEDKVNEIRSICEFLLKRRTVYPMEQIEYAIDYVKDKLIDEDGIEKDINEKDYEILLQEGAAFLLGETQKNLEEILHENNSLYWAASRDIKSIKFERSKKKRFDEGWHPSLFLKYRIFLLFEICVRLKRDKRGHIELPKKTTFEQVYEKGVKELQVQLTTYWDYVTAVKLQEEYSELIDIWSCNVVDRLMSLKSGSSNECSEISLVVGFFGHTIYLSLCKTSDSILVRVDNQLMVAIPPNTSHPKIMIMRYSHIYLHIFN
ncbi:hypothetical protein RFI_17077 [Reticulomyxa filosa]|uniref:NACHT domain-containing protein n=1 Tax=Reticulomyxa filosa TaxID=46433 RepID=X6N319_RETFI|nr:hypothetical protein RFI_17077 [Reticulomyxa filosa]|eukprot:ETO20144.1 hypothetical protein RFI_17077 [Reticulomyxa filosa]